MRTVFNRNLKLSINIELNKILKRSQNLLCKTTKNKDLPIGYFSLMMPNLNSKVSPIFSNKRNIIEEKSI